MSSTFDLVVSSERVVFQDGMKARDVGITNGQIMAIGARGTFSGTRTIDAGSKYVLPGGIDTHTHIEWPVGEEMSHDSFETATIKAAISGTTTVLDFVPPPRNGTSHLEAARQRAASALGRSAIDYGFHPILTDASEETLDDIGELVRMGMSSFKIYTTFADMRLNDGEILDVMRAISNSKGLAGFHAENHELIDHTIGKVVDSLGAGIASFAGSRPALAEASAIDLAALYARDLDAPIFIFHISGRDGLAALNRARELGVRARAESCTHYLAFTDTVYDRADGWKYVITPPLRSSEDQSALWSAVADSTLHAIGSDHCAYSLEQKRPGWSDFRRMPAGAPGIEFRMPVLWSEGVATGRISPVEFASITATEPAKTFGMQDQKGSIRVGADADLVVLDPDRHWTANTEVWASDYHPYAGMSGTGAVNLTIAGGRVIAEAGKYHGQLEGSFIPRSIDTSSW